MKRTKVALLLALGLATLAPAVAMAHTDVSSGLGFGGGYYPPEPVYVAPPRVYYAPEPVYYGPPVVYERTYYPRHEGWEHRWHDDDRRDWDHDHEWHHHHHDRDDD